MPNNCSAPGPQGAHHPTPTRHAEHRQRRGLLTSFLCIESVCSFNTSHFGLHSQLTIPSSLTATIPLRTICELLDMSELRLGEPPMPEYEELYEEPEGDEVPTEKEEAYPELESTF